MLNKLFFIMVISLFVTVNAQKPTEDDIREVEALLDSAYEKTTIADMKTSGLFAKKALKLSKEKSYTSGEAWSTFFIGQALFELGVYKEALSYLQKSESINKTVKDNYLSFEIYRVRSRVFGSMELLDKAIIEQKKGIDIIPEISKPQSAKDFLRGLANENLAISYSKVGDKASFYHYLKENEELLGKQDPSIVYLNLITLYTLFGNYYTNESEFDKAYSYFVKAEETSVKSNYPYISFTYLKWGDMELARDEPKAALQYFKRSLDILNKTNFKNEIPETYDKLSIVYKRLGDDQKSKDFKFKALELRDVLKTEQLQASSLAVEEIVKAHIEKENENFSKHKIILMGGILFVLVLLFVLLIKYYKTSKTGVRKKRIIEEKEEELKSKEKEINELNQKVNESFEEVVKLAKSNSPEFYTRFSEVYPEIGTQLLVINPKLSIAELTLSAYIFLGFTTKDIVSITFTSINTVKSRKYYLRKKLNISAGESTEAWFKNLRE